MEKLAVIAFAAYAAMALVILGGGGAVAYHVLSLQHEVARERAGRVQAEAREDRASRVMLCLSYREWQAAYLRMSKDGGHTVEVMDRFCE